MMHRGLEVRGEVPVTCRPSRRTSHSYSNSGHCTRCSSMNCRSRGTRRPRRRHPPPSFIASSPDRVGVFGHSTRLAAFRSGPVLPNMDAEHANGADVSESAAGLPGGHRRETRQTIESIIGYTRRRESRDDASAGFASSASWCSGASSDPGPDASWHTSIMRLRLTSARRSRRPPAPPLLLTYPQIHHSIGRRAPLFCPALFASPCPQAVSSCGWAPRLLRRSLPA
jgi:hypothetical protein